MAEFLVALSDACVPMREASSTPIRVYGDFTGFVPQPRGVVDLIRQHLFEVRSRGLVGVAIVNATTLVKSQYRRLSEGGEVGFFDSLAEARFWLRRVEVAQAKEETEAS